jgi:aryl-alcohol dehydrogenase-like predicted oxidoreductase
MTVLVLLHTVCNLAYIWRNVLVQPEDVAGVVGALDRSQPLKGAAVSSGAVVALVFAHEVDVFAVGHVRLEDLRQQGKLDLIGLSSAGQERIEQALELVEISEIQNSYSIIDREDDPIVELCREREIAFVPFFPLGSAFTGGPAKLAQAPTISKVAEKHGATASQVALAWLLARYERMLLIPGTTSDAHLEENLAAFAWLSDAGPSARRGGAAQTRYPRRRSLLRRERA